LENPERAVRIAKGFESAPSGIRQNAIAIASLEMLKDRNQVEYLSALTATTQRATKAGQEIEALKHIAKDSPEYFISKAIKDRMEKVKIDYDKTQIDKDTGNKITRNKAVSQKISKDAKRINKQIDKRASDMKSAQEIINSILCK
jgi:hypothetical protein